MRSYLVEPNLRNRFNQDKYRNAAPEAGKFRLSRNMFRFERARHHKTVSFQAFKVGGEADSKRPNQKLRLARIIQTRSRKKDVLGQSL